MTWAEGEIEKGLEDGLRQLQEQERKETAAKIRFILYTNLARGRIATYLDENPAAIPQGYVFRVADFYEQLNDYVHQLQVLKSSEEWLPLLRKMELWAFYYLRRSRFRSKDNLSQLAADYAALAGVQLIDAYFPYDVVFDSWAHALVQRVCSKNVRKESKSSLVPDNQLVDLEKALPYLSDSSSEGSKEFIELSQDLIAAVNQLPENDKVIILLRHAEGLTFELIAARMGISVATAHRRYFAVLKELRKILEGIRYK